MIEMKSDAVTLNGTSADVYYRLSHPGELNSLISSAIQKARNEGKDIPDDIEANLAKVNFSEDSISINGGPTGALTFRLGERRQNEFVQYKGESTPVPISIEFHLTSQEADNCILTLAIKAEIPIFIRPMVDKPLRKALDTFITLIQKISSWHR